LDEPIIDERDTRKLELGGSGWNPVLQISHGKFISGKHERIERMLHLAALMAKAKDNCNVILGIDW